MKYFSINHISDFEFHDSYWELLSYDSSILVLNARNLNIHKDALQNSDMCDMEIGSAVIAFDNFKLISHNPTEGIEEPNASEKACISDVTETSIKVSFMKLEMVSQFIISMKTGLDCFNYKPVVKIHFLKLFFQRILFELNGMM